MRALVRKANEPSPILKTPDPPQARPRGPRTYGESEMKSFFDKLSKPLEWTADQIKARPKGALVLWAVSVAIVALVF